MAKAVTKTLTKNDIPDEAIGWILDNVILPFAGKEARPRSVRSSKAKTRKGSF